MKRRAPPAAWHRLAIWLSGLALLSLLMAPAALLAQDLQTGKLGGICSASVGSASIQSGDEDTTAWHAHCPLCSVSWGLPLSVAQWAPAHAPQRLVSVAAAADPAALVAGLPFSRGPPAL